MPGLDAAPARKQHRHTLPAHRFTRRQRSHFAACVVLPSVLAVLMPFALPTGWLNWAGVGVWAFMWFLVGCVGVSMGLHRHFSHRAFAANGLLRTVMGVCGCMAAQGTISYWVSLHRAHHTHSDQAGDAHSPVPQTHGLSSKTLAFLQGHIGWTWRHDVPSPLRYAADLIRDPVVVRIDSLYGWIVASGVVLPGLAGVAIWGAEFGGFNGFLLGAYWGGWVRLAVGHHIVWAINSVCHTAEHRSAATGDHSVNVGWLSVLSWGESWHHNHHLAATSASFKHAWWQLDVGWVVIQLAARLGWATGVKRH